MLKNWKEHKYVQEVLEVYEVLFKRFNKFNEFKRLEVFSQISNFDFVYCLLFDVVVGTCFNH